MSIVTLSAFKENDCKQTEQGLEYRGTVAKTASNRECQRWTDTVPHYHDVPFLESLSATMQMGGLAVCENFCRNFNETKVRQRPVE